MPIESITSPVTHPLQVYKGLIADLNKQQNFCSWVDRVSFRNHRGRFFLAVQEASVEATKGITAASVSTTEVLDVHVGYGWLVKIPTYHGNLKPSFLVVISPIFLGPKTFIFPWCLGSNGRWWQLKYFLMFTPDPWENDPIWRSYFSNGLVKNHQRASVFFPGFLKHFHCMQRYARMANLGCRFPPRNHSPIIGFGLRWFF